MGISDLLKQAGYTPEKSTVGERVILTGIYKVMLADGQVQEPNQYGQSYMAKFKITETLKGKESTVQFPEFTEFFAIDDANVASKAKGMAKLLNGLCSVGITIDQSSDEALYAGLKQQIGVAELYVQAKSKKKKVKDAEGNWIENEDPDGEHKQVMLFMTEKNARKLAGKA